MRSRVRVAAGAPTQKVPSSRGAQRSRMISSVGRLSSWFDAPWETPLKWAEINPLTHSLCLWSLNRVHNHCRPNRTVKLPDFVWIPEVYLKMEAHIIRDWHALVMFNLYLCENTKLGHSYLCPDVCFGVKKAAKLVSGNPCGGVKDTRSPRCFSVRASCTPFVFDDEDRKRILVSK